MTPRRRAIYQDIENLRASQDTASLSMGVPGPASVDRDPLERIDHLRALVGQLAGARDPVSFLVGVAAQAVAWVEALDEAAECRVETGEAAAQSSEEAFDA